LAASSSSSELCISLVGVFFARNDISVSTILGSASYNLLIITSLCSFCVYHLNIKLEIYPVIRDSLFYSINLIVFYLFLFKNNYMFLYWYDSLISISVYICFILINLFEKQIFQIFISNPCKKTKKEPNENDIELVETLNPQSVPSTSIQTNSKNERELSIRSDYDEPVDFFLSFKRFKLLPFWSKVKLILVSPAHSFAFITILDFRRFEKYKNVMLFVTIALSLFLISLCSYILVWMVLITCDTLKISETILGFAILSAATSMDETICSISICRREIKRMQSESENKNSTKLNMALSNLIGSNIFDISIGIGLPYLFNSLLFTHGRHFTKVYSTNITFMLFGLLTCLVLYLLLLKAFNWKLTRSFGLLILFIWLVYTILVIILEMNLVEFDFFNFYFKKCK